MYYSKFGAIRMRIVVFEWLTFIIRFDIMYISFLIKYKSYKR